MANTILLDRALWDLVLDVNGDIALAAEPYALAQDAASAIRTFLGECYLDTTVGVPYLQQILGKTLSVPLLKELIEEAALTVPGVASASCFLSAVNERGITGQVQVTSVSTGQVSVAPFTTINPQGAG